jgi:hypothetical protein
VIALRAPSRMTRAAARISAATDAGTFAAERLLDEGMNGVWRRMPSRDGRRRFLALQPVRDFSAVLAVIARQTAVAGPAERNRQQDVTNQQSSSSC